jgi:phenylacetate-CoA ligase
MQLEPAGPLRRVANTTWVAGLSWRERNLPRWPLDRLEALQGGRIHAIAAHAYRTVPFYRRAMDELGLAPATFRTPVDLAQLPLIDGEQLARRPEDFSSTSDGPGTYQTFHTSGSESGIRRAIRWDAGYLLRTLAWAERDRVTLTCLAGEDAMRGRVREALSRTRLQRLLGNSADHQRISIFPGHAEMRVMRKLWSEQTLIPARPAHHHFVPAQSAFSEVLESINSIRPRIAFSFGSFADQFFRRLADTGQELAAPRVWVITSDEMSEQAREIAEHRYGCRIFSVYSTMEAHRLGVQCERRQGFHLNIDAYAVRIVDRDGQDVGSGTSGEIVVSNLRNRAMVLLNYRLGDRGILDPEPCPCGRTLPLLARFEGRRSETVVLPDGTELSSLALEGLFRAELRPTLKARAEQPRPGSLRWLIVPFQSADPEAIRQAIVRRGSEVLGETDLEVEVVPDIPSSASGKFSRVVGALSR